MDNTHTIWQDRHVRGALVLVLLLTALFLLVQTINGIKEFRFIGGGVPASGTVSVSGEGEVFAVPDVVTFTFSVIEERGTAPAAQEAAARKVNEVLAFVEEQGIEEKDIKTVNFNLFPRYELRRDAAGAFPSPGGRRVLAGFEVNQTVEVKVRDTKGAGALVAGVSERGASSVSGLSFEIDDEEELQARARAKAIEDAREKAKVLADDLGVRLVRVVSFSESGAPRPFFDAALEQRALGVGGAEAPIAPELPAGENKITSRVAITYEIR